MRKTIGWCVFLGLIGGFLASKTAIIRFSEVIEGVAYGVLAGAFISFILNRLLQK